MLSAVTYVAQAQTPPQPAAPSLTSSAAAQTLFATWFAPQAAQAAQSAAALHAALHAYCAAQTNIDAPRQAFAQAVLAWERLGAVAMGPQVQRRTARTVDFQPLRSAPFKAVLAQPPKSLVEMETVGGPAKGFAALEVLLFSDPAAPKTAHCAYATLASKEIYQEFQSLEHDLQILNAKRTQQLPDFGANAEMLNQWLGGLERLRWLNIEKPLRSASAKKPAQLLRTSSGLTVEGWAAQWQGLRALAAPSLVFLAEQGRDLNQDLLQSMQEAAAQGQLNIATLTYAQGWQHLSTQWLQAVLDVDVEMAKLQQQTPATQAITVQTVAAAVQAMARLKALLEGEIAPALQVSIGFSDADGD